jgi:pSer/pThr/pTyr-binding forkhead associated (FHA) protein
MPLIRCPKCGQAYDVPGAVAVRLTNSIATCHCGEWIAGSKAQVLARMLNPDQIKEVDLQPYRVEATAPPFEVSAQEQQRGPIQPRSIRVNARGEQKSINTVFTIGEHPLWIGSRGCHVELPESELSLRHCSISLRGDELVLRDADSHVGTFLDGQKITESVIEGGTHVVRAGAALITLEPTEETGTPVEPVSLEAEDIFDESVLHAMEARASGGQDGGKRLLLVCVDGALNGQEFEIPPGGLIVGREGHVRVPDEYLSRKHFEVVADPDGNVRVRDLGSRNGTFLNTLPASNTKVQKGDEIRAGVNRFRIEVRA